MRRVLILSETLSVETNQFDADKFCELLNANDAIHVEYMYYTDLVYYIDGKGKSKVFHQYTGKDIGDYDIVYRKRSDFVQHHAKACAQYVQYKGNIFIDSEFSHQLNTNAHKLVEHMTYAVNNLTFPDTLIVTPKNAEKALQFWESQGYTYPAVLKSLTSTRGDYNFLVGSAEEALQAVQDAPVEYSEFALQPFIENDADYRFLVLGYETKLIIKRQRGSDSKSHTNNTSQGAQASLVELSEMQAEAIELANQSARIFGREVAGVDIMFVSATGTPLILEVNRSPQIEQGAFVEQKAAMLAEFLANYQG